MTDKEGTLRLQSTGRWAICRPGREPFELLSGKDGLQLTRMELRHKETVGGVVQLAGYYSIDGHVLRDGLRAAIG
jgi:hypothetical protein